MKLMRAHGSIVIVPRRNSRAAWAGLLDPHGDHTCGWTTSHCTVTVPGDTGSVGDAVHHRGRARLWSPPESAPTDGHQRETPRRTLASQRQDTGESHSSAPPSQPIRSRQAPVPSRYTRSVAMHPIRRGAIPTDRVHRLIDIKLARGLPR